MRALFEALARSNYVTDAAQPKNPRTGMIRVLVDAATEAADLQMYLQVGGVEQWVTLVRRVDLGFPVARTQQYPIAAPAAVWTINHGLGTTAIQFQAFDTSGNKLNAATERILDANTVQITHGAPLAGYVNITG